jgi:hypothetical protein
MYSDIEEGEGEEEREAIREKVRNAIRERIFIAKPVAKQYRQRKKLKGGEERVYDRIDYFVRLSSKKKINPYKPVIVSTWDDLEQLLTVKDMYGISDSEFSLLLAEIVSGYLD